MCGGVKKVFSLCQWAKKPPRKRPTHCQCFIVNVTTLHLAQRHSQLRNGHYERKIMAQRFSPGGTMGLFSPRHGMSGRAEAAELYFWTRSSITERLCAMWMCQVDWNNLESSALGCFTYCRHQHSHSVLLRVSSIPLPFHCFIGVIASPGITGDKKRVFFLFYQ